MEQCDTAAGHRTAKLKVVPNLMADSVNVEHSTLTVHIGWNVIQIFVETRSRSLYSIIDSDTVFH
jgi:hypothetical protein